MTTTTRPGFKHGPAYDRLIAQAKDQGLLISPYPSSGPQDKAFVNGYETALSDLALGRLSKDPA